MKSLPQLLADAFQEDPLNTFVEPDPQRRYHKGLWLYGKIVELVHERGLVNEIPGKGAALWLKPGSSGISLRDCLRMGMLQWPVKLGLGATRRLVQANTGLGQLPPETHNPSYWYLFILAVDESARGQGIMRKLLQPVLDESDRTGVPIRLETNRAKNVTIYEHFGFHVVNHSDQIPTLEQWNLIRTPRSDK